jgi:4-amino-4-deoxy-L-arabinose transferase-like glycosyltransferase
MFGGRGTLTPYGRLEGPAVTMSGIGELLDKSRRLLKEQRMIFPAGLAHAARRQRDGDDVERGERASVVGVRLWLLGLVLLFVVGLLPYAGSFFHHHMDERFYTNAAITMVQSGDAFTPRWLDGSVALQKPILTYWMTAASYALFGINPFTSRIPTMLAGVLIIVLTYRVTLGLTGNRDRAFLAALITFSQHQLIIASIHSIPDVFLCLFMLVSGWGFLSLIARGRRTPGAYWAAYGSAGLAVATKGLLAVVFVAFAWLFAWLYRVDARSRPPLRSLLHGPSMLVGAVVAGWWYAAMTWTHGSLLWRTFVTDQMIEDTEVHGEQLYRIPIYFVLLLVNLLPWTLAVVELWWRDRRSLAAPDDEERALFWLIVLWSAMVAVISGFINSEDGRYLLPVGPLGAIVLAGVIERADPVARRLALRHLLALSFAAMVGLGLVLAAIRVRIGPPMAGIAVLALFASVITAVALATYRWRWLTLATAVAVMAFVPFPLTAISLRPVFAPDAGVREAAEELARGADPSRPVLFAGGENAASRVRLASGGVVHIVRSPVPPDASRATWPDAMVLPVADAARLDLSGYRTREVTLGIGSITLTRLSRLILAGHAAEMLDRLRERYVVATRH